ncbi:GntR family transcriptional regulator [Porphyromonas circumdentaria]|uniref:Transcriptional regulator, GntR family n=1 Tax=Porphyromonas circumdentaria TaxID=29524 RepID=A0A1T4Q0G4_9PORP|nr:GntR family transcriptional regulator [Porphyromonas circumdentaria]MBB6276586.1 DNA-binding transcriptional regulator YhcF (GntR family) [Porphyromonas circumdentaria]SJZ97017.1 transcriptional regulator, GntR family [Porphyromonas circumdentaria]
MNPIHPQSIFLQIADQIKDAILAGRYNPGEKIPSVREMAANLEVNPNTVVKAYEQLIAGGLIASQLGVGFFVCEGALERVLALRRNIFFKDIVPTIVKEMHLLYISEKDGIEAITDCYRSWQEEHTDKKTEQ